jgi:hypothetical protein
MTTATLSDPASVQIRLEEIDGELAILQNDLEDAALTWFKAKKNREQAHAAAFIAAEGPVAERTAKADLAMAGLGIAEEACYEALKAKSRVLEARASIGMSILRSQGRS